MRSHDDRTPGRAGAKPSPTARTHRAERNIAQPERERYLQRAQHEATRVIARLSATDAPVAPESSRRIAVRPDNAGASTIRRGQGSSRNKRRKDEDEEDPVHAEPLTDAEVGANMPALDGPLDAALVTDLAEALNLPGMIARIRDEVVDDLMEHMAVAAYAVKEMLRRDGADRDQAVASFLAREAAGKGQSWMNPDSIERFRAAMRAGDRRLATAIVHGLDLTLTGERACENVADVIARFLPGFVVHRYKEEHYFLRKGDIIVDGSWKQFLDKNLAKQWRSAPTVFVGTIAQLEELLSRYISSKRYLKEVLNYYRQSIAK